MSTVREAAAAGAARTSERRPPMTSLESTTRGSRYPKRRVARPRATRRSRKASAEREPVDANAGRRRRGELVQLPVRTNAELGEEVLAVGGDGEREAGTQPARS